MPEPGSTIALIHLAALVSVPMCEQDPDRAWAVNVDGAGAYVRSFLEWGEARGHRPTVVYVSTGHVYAASQQRVPITEDAPLAPRSTYAKSKLAGEHAVTRVAEEAACPLVITRVFGLVAPGQPAHYLLPALIQRVQNGDVTDIPGLSNVRDYLDARDVVGHLCDLADWATRDGGETPTIVNVCSGIAVPVGRVLDVVIGVVLGSGPEADRIRAMITEAPGRATDAPWLVGSPSKLHHLTGNPPQSISLETTVRDAVATL